MVWGLLGGDTLGPLGYAGLAVALVAVVLVGFVPGEGSVRPSARGLTYAVGSGLGIGAMIVLLDQAGDDSGVLPLLANRVANASITWTVVLALVLVALRAGRPARSALTARTGGPGRRAWVLAIACGLTDTTANVLLLEALRSGELAVVGALTALYPAGTILLAAIVLRERIAAVQWVGLALALTAGALLAVG
jgi:drug/metabolite transporter (DMT)-like permease